MVHYDKVIREILNTSNTALAYEFVSRKQLTVGIENRNFEDEREG